MNSNTATATATTAFVGATGTPNPISPHPSVQHPPPARAVVSRQRGPKLHPHLLPREAGVRPPPSAAGALSRAARVGVPPAAAAAAAAGREDRRAYDGSEARFRRVCGAPDRGDEKDAGVREEEQRSGG